MAIGVLAAESSAGSVATTAVRAEIAVLTGAIEQVPPPGRGW